MDYVYECPFGKAPRGNVRGVAVVGQALGCTYVPPGADTFKRLLGACYCKQVAEGSCERRLSEVRHALPRLDLHLTRSLTLCTSKNVLFKCRETSSRSSRAPRLACLLLSIVCWPPCLGIRVPRLGGRSAAKHPRKVLHCTSHRNVCSLCSQSGQSSVMIPREMGVPKGDCRDALESQAWATSLWGGPEFIRRRPVAN